MTLKWVARKIDDQALQHALLCELAQCMHKCMTIGSIVLEFKQNSKIQNIWPWKWRWNSLILLKNCIQTYLTCFFVCANIVTSTFNHLFPSTLCCECTDELIICDSITLLENVHVCKINGEENYTVHCWQFFDWCSLIRPMSKKVLNKWLLVLSSITSVVDAQ